MKKLLFLSSIILLAACKSQQSSMTSSTPKNEAFAYELVAQSTLHDIGKNAFAPGLYKFSDKAHWDKFLQKMQLANEENAKFKLDKIDFEKEMLVAIFDKILSHGGVKFYIDRVENTPDAIKFITAHQSRQGQMSIQVMNQPYIIVKIKKTDKRLELINK